MFRIVHEPIDAAALKRGLADSRAGACVQRRAKKISDTQLRRSFVERVPHNARVMALLKESAAAAC